MINTHSETVSSEYLRITTVVFFALQMPSNFVITYHIFKRKGNADHIILMLLHNSFYQLLLFTGTVFYEHIVSSELITEF